MQMAQKLVSSGKRQACNTRHLAHLITAQHSQHAEHAYQIHDICRTASSGHSKLWVFRDGAEETLAFMAAVADLIIAFRLQARLSHSTAQEEQGGAPLAAP